LKVSTRHVGDSEGVEFVARLETDPIELRRIHRPVGTTISIKLRPPAAKKLLEEIREHSWRHAWGKLPDSLYVLSTPSLQLVVNDTSYRRGTAWPAAREDLPHDWHRLDVSDFRDIQWRHGESRLACNGIAVGSYHLMEKAYWYDSPFGIRS